MCKLFNKGAFLQGDMEKQQSWTLSIAIEWSEKIQLMKYQLCPTVLFSFKSLRASPCLSELNFINLIVQD